MNCYIIHYTKNVERLENYKKDLFLKLRSLPFIKSIHIITDFDREHEFIKNIKNSRLKTGELSCSKKHFEAWRLFKETTDEYCMVLEDDLLYEDRENFVNEMTKMYNEIKSNYNVITFGSGLERHADKKGFTPMTHGRCTDSYIISKKFLEYHENEIYTLPIGHYMNNIMIKNDDLFYYYEPTIVKQGSQNNYYTTDIRNY
jgi:GR25 family glycosyltransferase involved in LPS biosynthesis